MSSIKYPVLIIPAYNPDDRLISLLKEHRELFPEQQCIIVNDGSEVGFLNVFKQLETSGYIVLHHQQNQGKGAALRTAMNYYLAVFSDKAPGVVTADADGQHSVQDIIHLSQRFSADSSRLYLGIRQIAKANIPLRSRFGNILTKFLFNLITRSRIKDTQTGLRGVPNQLIRSLVMTSTKRYEFEFEMFFIAKKFRVSIEQLPIETIYIDNNKGSHFNPLLDSLRIYFIFLRFCSVAIFSFLLDFSMFSLIYFVSQHAALAVFGARLISAPVNFILNKNLSFKSHKSLLVSAFQYFILVAIMSASSFYVMNFIHYTGLSIYISKIIAEFLIFMANFLIQYLVIFTKRSNLISLSA
ncbi:bifunctional glycosyltransferase family 2/GtrA family protein [Legionella jamestowniensis]|uniref:Glycosyltransferase n=1 Tax=Legionella jamestowniensis TaxID=455 RepID=A0A0W0UK07_9GAMM|nr:bifunctional glycosyltransferase family 2/GtrA family protein [Legionella jamestowniensis]KTD07865.1 glycosyltransferase [Legionella jamestowniensis]SFL63357.1 Putative flippase GtrA (transmembrane translocase of bactoprenol-linked glucose) [Legionella jamestowniensis DSM 19215]